MNTMYKVLIALVLVLSISQMQAQDTTEEALPEETELQDTCGLFEKEQLTFMLGYGIEYGVLGGKLKYKLHDNLSAIANIGSAYRGLRWGIGVEASTGHRFSKVLAPYFSVFYGLNRIASLTSRSDFKEAKAIEAFTLGVGLNVKFSTKTYFSAGLNYVLKSRELNRFADDFNDTYQANYFYSNHFSPSLGLAIRIWE